MAGALFENRVIQETVKQFYNNGIRPNLYYLRASNGLEIDLLIEKANVLYLFDIKFMKSPRLTMAKGINRFHEIFSKWNIHKGSLITLSRGRYPLNRLVDVLGFGDFIESLNDYFSIYRN